MLLFICYITPAKIKSAKMESMNKPQPYEPEKCWVNNKQKICYPDKETAEDSARLVEYEHGLPVNSLTCYKCEYGNHWHLANKKDPLQ